MVSQALKFWALAGCWKILPESVSARGCCSLRRAACWGMAPCFPCFPRNVGCRTSCLLRACTGSRCLWPSTALPTSVIFCTAQLPPASSMPRGRFVKEDRFPFSIASRENGFSLSAKSTQITKAFCYCPSETKKISFPIAFPMAQT